MVSLPAHLVNPVCGMGWTGLDWVAGWIPVFLELNSSVSRELVIVINGGRGVCMYVEYNACKLINCLSGGPIERA